MEGIIMKLLNRAFAHHRILNNLHTLHTYKI